MRDVVEGFLQTHHVTLYTLLFFGTIAVVALWEGIAPLRPLTASLRRRWIGNAGILMVNTALLWIVAPSLAVGTSLAAWSADWGLLRWLDVPFWPACIAGILLMDLSRYLEHYLLHVVPALWRIHRVHHTDLDFDVTTAVRFHPAETLVMNLARVTVVAVLGVPVLAVLVYELCYPLTTFWVHANVRLPAGVDRAMRWLLLTPDMHRAHHSIVPNELNSNFGGLFSFWDRLFRTYTDEPAAGHLGMVIGVAGFQDPKHLSLGWMLANPALADEPRLAHPETAKVSSA